MPVSELCGLPQGRPGAHRVQGAPEDGLMLVAGGGVRPGGLLYTLVLCGIKEGEGQREREKHALCQARSPVRRALGS